MSNTKKKDECLELKNIKYQTMLINKKIVSEDNTDNAMDIDSFLKRERLHISKKPWSKLEKGTKRKKLGIFADMYNTKNKEALKLYLYHCLERKKLQRTKDVNYDITTGKIIQIPGLAFNKTTNKYTLRKVDKKGSSLKSLAPKRSKSKKQKTKIDIHLKDN